MLSNLLLPSTMATKFKFPILDSYQDSTNAFKEGGLDSFKGAIREDMGGDEKKPKATLAFIQSNRNGSPLVRDLSHARTAMVVGAEEAGKHLQDLGLDFKPWYDLIQVVYPPG